MNKESKSSETQCSRLAISADDIIKDKVSYNCLVQVLIQSRTSPLYEHIKWHKLISYHPSVYFNSIEILLLIKFSLSALHN